MEVPEGKRSERREWVIRMRKGGGEGRRWRERRGKEDEGEGVERREMTNWRSMTISVGWLSKCTFTQTGRFPFIPHQSSQFSFHQKQTKIRLVVVGGGREPLAPRSLLHETIKQTLAKMDGYAFLFFSGGITGGKWVTPFISVLEDMDREWLGETAAVNTPRCCCQMRTSGGGSTCPHQNVNICGELWCCKNLSLAIISPSKRFATILATVTMLRLSWSPQLLVWQPCCRYLR